jgi:mannose-1-phosphate guanylyltransferase
MSQQQERKLWGIVLAAGEGTRVCDFLAQLCGGRGIKQFCAVVGRRSMLEHTLARVERLIPRERILVVVSTDHREEVTAQLSRWPADNVIFQPRNRDTAPGILLPLAYLSRRDSLANVAIFPSDHCIVREERFMSAVGKAAAEVQRFPHEMILLGMGPDRAEEGYGWIEPAAAEAGRETRAVCRFWEKPSAVDRHMLLARGALWNTFVCVAWTPTLWATAHKAIPDVDSAFIEIRQALGRPHAPLVIERVYEALRAVNFSAGICEPLAAELRVLPVPDVGWSDWGSVERIYTSLEQMGKLDDCLARLRHRKSDAALALPLLKQHSPGMRLG